jgi:uncharacterized protein (TIGR03086 family)
MTPMPTDLIELLSRASGPTEAVLAQLHPEHRDRPTPCPEMTVAQVAAHLIGGLRGFTEVANGGELRFDPVLDPALDGERVDVVFRSAVDALIAAFARPGRLDASYAMPWGPTTGGQLVGFELIETVVHGWDIARGLGVGIEVEEPVAAATLTGARQWVDESVRVPGMFGPEIVVTDAGPLEELVAFLGRDPSWTP